MNGSIKGIFAINVSRIIEEDNATRLKIGPHCEVGG